MWKWPGQMSGIRGATGSSTGGLGGWTAQVAVSSLQVSANSHCALAGSFGVVAGPQGWLLGAVKGAAANPSCGQLPGRPVEWLGTAAEAEKIVMQTLVSRLPTRSNPVFVVQNAQGPSGTGFWSRAWRTLLPRGWSSDTARSRPSRQRLWPPDAWYFLSSL
jgi:hypothetical protein